jgi:CheY-like chemotaxis protein
VQTTLREAARPAPDPGENRVLYVDDDATQQAAFARCMSAHGFRVDAVAKHAEALWLAERFPYPVIVTELRRPEIDGLFLISELHTLQPAASFILATADSCEIATPDPLYASIACLLRKPWDERELGQVLTNAYALHQQRKTPPPPLQMDEHWSVLLIEDDREDAELVSQHLQQCGACGDVAHCARLSSALALLEAQSFDAVISALDLPDAMGLEAFGQLQCAAPEAALIALSPDADPTLYATLIGLGAQDCLIKGAFDRVVLRLKLQHAIGQKRLARG